MIWLRHLLLILCGAGFGLLAAAGVFTILVAVGLVPRFAGRTHTAGYVILYEEMVIFGTVVGSFLSVFARYSQAGDFLRSFFPNLFFLWDFCGVCFQLVFGVFSGMFIGCLALAIAEMLDSIPIFSRRIGFRHGLGLAILAMALGKVTGSLFYFLTELERTVH